MLRLMLLLVVAVASVYGHGRLLEPPSRASAWRAGFDTPVNWDDNELFCGGFDVRIMPMVSPQAHKHCQISSSQRKMHPVSSIF